MADYETGVSHAVVTDDTHLCHAENCRTVIPPRLFMCRRHWYMLPYRLRSNIWRHYVPGQEITKTPTEAYTRAAREAIKYVHDKEAHGG